MMHLLDKKCYFTAESQSTNNLSKHCNGAKTEPNFLKYKILLFALTVLQTKTNRIIRFSACFQETPLISQLSEHKLNKKTYIQDHATTTHVLSKFSI